MQRLLAIALLLPGLVLAQAYPVKPARLMGQALGDTLGQQVVIDYSSAGSGIKIE